MRVVGRHGTNLGTVSDSMGFSAETTIVERDQYGNPLVARVEKRGRVDAVGEKRWTF